MDSPIVELWKLDDLLVPDIRVETLSKPALDRAGKFDNPAYPDEFIAGKLALLRFAASLLEVDSARLVPDYRCPQCGQDKTTVVPASCSTAFRHLWRSARPGRRAGCCWPPSCILRMASGWVWTLNRLTGLALAASTTSH